MLRPRPERGVSFEQATEADFEDLLAIRVAAMRESLERLGRFDPARVRERFRRGFEPNQTWHVVVAGERVGFVAVKPRGEWLLLDDLYLQPERQGQGIGGAVLTAVFDAADERGVAVRVGTLRGSDSNGFYSRHGFVRIGEADWVIFYERSARAGRADGA